MEPSMLLVPPKEASTEDVAVIVPCANGVAVGMSEAKATAIALVRPVRATPPTKPLATEPEAAKVAILMGTAPVEIAELFVLVSQKNAPGPVGVVRVVM